MISIKLPTELHTIKYFFNKSNAQIAKRIINVTLSCIKMTTTVFFFQLLNLKEPYLKKLTNT